MWSGSEEGSYVRRIVGSKVIMKKKKKERRATSPPTLAWRGRQAMSMITSFGLSHRKCL